MRAVLFDTFGTVVDWRTGVGRQAASFAADRGQKIDAAAFADNWGALYQPAMEAIRTGTRDFATLNLTLEAIRRFYDGGTSPLASTIDRHADFFELFGSFKGYIDHFVLGDFLDEGGAVRFLLPFDNYETPALPSDLPTYARYRLDSLKLFKARRLSISNEIMRRCVLG